MSKPWRRLMIGLIVLAVIFAALTFRGNSPRDSVLEQAGPVDPDAPEEWSTTSSGIRYRILRQGEGRKPQSIDTITMHYASWLDDEMPFDNSYLKQPLESPLTHIASGWVEGLELLREGGMIELEVPGELGFEREALGSEVPPDSTLHVIAELLEVESPNRPPGAGPRDPDAPDEFTTTESGLKYRILRQGDGPKPTRYDRIVINYKGWLDDGKVFDSSYHRDSPTTFGLEEAIIAGWVEGLQLLGEGGMIELEIPSELGYGSSSMPGIPPNATLHFLIEILEVK